MRTKLYSGCYRTSSTLSYAFGHIRQLRDNPNRGLWQAEIRKSETGDLIRPAGIWNTLREAESECNDLLWRDYRVEGWDDPARLLKQAEG